VLPFPTLSTSSSATPNAEELSRRRLMPVAALMLAVLGGVIGDHIRYDLIEPVARAAACVESPAPWWCILRDALRIASQNFVIAGGALLGAFAALLYRGRGAVVGIVIAMVLGGMGMFLYSTALAAVAITLGLVRAAMLDRA
jgi:hypothetical protein